MGIRLVLFFFDLLGCFFLGDRFLVENYVGMAVKELLDGFNLEERRGRFRKERLYDLKEKCRCLQTE